MGGVNHEVQLNSAQFEVAVASAAPQRLFYPEQRELGAAVRAPLDVVLPADDAVAHVGQVEEEDGQLAQRHVVLGPEPASERGIVGGQRCQGERR